MKSNQKRTIAKRKRLQRKTVIAAAGVVTCLMKENVVSVNGRDPNMDRFDHYCYKNCIS